jgi:sortase A
VVLRRTRPAILIVAALIALAVAASEAQSVEPDANLTVSVGPAAVAIGGRVVVSLGNWPDTTVSAMVCGNDARRGSQDCALAGAEAVRVRNGAALIDLDVVAPPVGCPCVVRVATSSSDLVRTAALLIDGVPGGTLIEPAGSHEAEAIKVRARVIEPEGSTLDQLASAFGGSSSRVLVLEITNHTDQPVAGLRVAAGVGRADSSSEPIASRPIGPVAPSAERIVRVPFDIAAPAWGHYAVSGKVYGLASPVPFSASASNDAWGWWLLVPCTLLALAQALRRRERRGVVAPVPLVRVAPHPEPAFHGSSRVVGVAVGNGWQTAPYDSRNGQSSTAGAAPARTAGVT